MIKALVVDDQRIFRTLPGIAEEDNLSLTYVTTTQDAKGLLYAQPWDIVVLDHDLGMESEGSGTDLVNYIERRFFSFNDRPLVGAYLLCSFNPSGRRYQQQVLEHLGEQTYLIDASEWLDYEQMDKERRNPFLAGERR